jgi:hypothetical protein
MDDRTSDALSPAAPQSDVPDPTGSAGGEGPSRSSDPRAGNETDSKHPLTPHACAYMPKNRLGIKRDLAKMREKPSRLTSKDEG